MTDEERTQQLVRDLGERIGLMIAPEHLPAVAANFDLITRLAGVVNDAPGEPDDLATVFSA